MVDLHRRTIEGLPKVITANRLLDGVVVYLCPDGQWHSDISRACTFTDDVLEQGLAAGKAAEDRQEVVGTYAVDVSPNDHGLSARTWRERIRAEGPTTPYGSAAVWAF